MLITVIFNTGLKMYVYKLGVPEAPGRPQVVLQQVGARWVTLMWDVKGDGDAPLRNYTIQIRTGRHPGWINIPDYVPPDVTMFQVSK